MPTLRHALALLLTLLALIPSVAQNPAQLRPITARDLFSFVWIGDTQLSPDGHTVVFVQTTVTPAHDGYQSALYILDTAIPSATPRLLTPGTHDTNPRFSPDGQSIAFLRTPDSKAADAKPSPTQLYLTTPSGGSPIRLSDLPRGAGNPHWASATTLVVSASTPLDPAEAKLHAAQLARATGDDAHVSDVRIVTRAMHQLNGAGNLDPAFVSQLYLVTLPKPDGIQPPAIQLTGSRFGVQDFTLRPGSPWLFFTRLPVDEPYYEPVERNTLYAINLEQATPTSIPVPALTHQLPVEASGLALSPDGNHLAFHAQAFPIPPAAPVSHQQTDLFTLDLAWKKSTPTISSEPRNLTASRGFEMGGSVGGDNVAPRGPAHPAILWSADSAHLIDLAGSLGSALLVSVDSSTGDITPLSARHQAVLTFAAPSDQRSVVALVSNPLLIGDLFRIDPSQQPGGPHNGTGPAPAGNQTQLTHSNEALFSQLQLSMPQELHVTPTVNPNDIPYLTIDTFVQLPPSADPAAKLNLPTILNIHGGPHSAYGWIFDHEMLVLAAQGYAVIYPNPRGSTTYGQRFANVIESNYPGDDFHDLMDTVDAVIAKGWADPSRLGVTGGSGGGLLTDWVVTHTDRFKAAVAQRDITDQAAWWYTADINEFHQYWMPPAPFDNLDIYRAHSPITFINNLKTPMMFILGDADTRTPPTSGGEVFFRYLKYRHIPTVMVRFPRETHELSRSGEPWHRIERLDNISNWFARFLLNRCEPQYNIPPTPTCTQ